MQVTGPQHKNRVMKHTDDVVLARRLSRTDYRERTVVSIEVSKLSLTFLRTSPSQIVG